MLLPGWQVNFQLFCFSFSWPACFSKIITCGSDGDVRVWSGFDDEDPVQTCIGEWALCVRQKDSHLYIATDNNDVQLITYPENSRDGVLIRSTAHVSHMALREEHDVSNIL